MFFSPQTSKASALFNRACVALTFAAAVSLAHAQDMKAMDHSAHAMPATSTSSPSAATSEEMTKGEVTRWNASTGKVTIRHEEIKNINMPPMTMVFTLKNPADGAALKAGDKVRFHAEQDNGVLVITRIETLAP